MLVWINNVDLRHDNNFPTIDFAGMEKQKTDSQAGALRTLETL